ncbi:ATP-binding cassette domain-containing protein [Streptomyces sp. KMM 9044]|uniref:ATP-binding cassette domain-containing protein n=1 Tax=Streptomyces sp. KMM 9044 TaxID=2744474 RepID=UPI0021506F34|nr:ATP-binding cassette domain-containing protein [Streptomyces sp. KMM 9044]WAX81267.1 ATP-binding cassette domain-containing protein [Streptomyces sp. KMM 9044]
MDLDIGRGVTGLLGPNGAGKSTLLRTLATAAPPQAGTLEVNGVSVDGERSARAARSGIGYLPQGFGFDPGMRLLDFVVYGAWVRGIRKETLRSKAVEALQKVDLAEAHRMRMKQLSGGQRQRAGIAWAIVGEPALVILDEPTVGLDPRQRLHFRKILRGLSDAAVILSTHLIDDVDAVCDRVLVLQSGELRYDGKTADLVQLASDGMPGDTPLERAYMSLLPKEDRDL